MINRSNYNTEKDSIYLDFLKKEMCFTQKVKIANTKNNKQVFEFERNLVKKDKKGIFIFSLFFWLSWGKFYFLSTDIYLFYNILC